VAKRTLTGFTGLAGLTGLKNCRIEELNPQDPLIPKSLNP
jgi:hypothetical protein